MTTVSLGPRSSDILGYLDEVGPSGATVADLRARFGGNAARYAKRLHDAGHAVRAARGRYVHPAHALDIPTQKDTEDTRAEDTPDTGKDTGDTPSEDTKDTAAGPADEHSESVVTRQKDTLDTASEQSPEGSGDTGDTRPEDTSDTETAAGKDTSDSRAEDTVDTRHVLVEDTSDNVSTPGNDTGDTGKDTGPSEASQWSAMFRRAAESRLTGAPRPAPVEKSTTSRAARIRSGVMRWLPTTIAFVGAFLATWSGGVTLATNLGWGPVPLLPGWSDISFNPAFSLPLCTEVLLAVAVHRLFAVRGAAKAVAGVIVLIAGGMAAAVQVYAHMPVSELPTWLGPAIGVLPVLSLVMVAALGSLKPRRTA